MTRDYLRDDTGLRVWFRDEIRNALLAAYATSTAQPRVEASAEAAAFRRGFLSALVAIGLNFGIVGLPFAEDGRPVLTDVAASLPRDRTQVDSRS